MKNFIKNFRIHLLLWTRDYPPTIADVADEFIEEITHLARFKQHD